MTWICVRQVINGQDINYTLTFYAQGEFQHHVKFW